MTIGTDDRGQSGQEFKHIEESNTHVLGDDVYVSVCLLRMYLCSLFLPDRHLQL